MALDRDAYVGGHEGQLPSLSSSIGAGGARIALLTFSSVVGSLVLENFLSF